MNKAEANSSFCPLALVKRLLERIQISSGMLKMRVSVMEFGRFTTGGQTGVPTTPNYPPLGKWKAMSYRASGSGGKELRGTILE